MNILITGGAGFIGSHLTQQLMNQHDITIVDMLHSYYAVERKEERLNHLKKHGTYQFCRVDILNFDSLKEVFEQQKFDAIIHLAALPGVAYSVEQPNEYVDYDIKGTINVLKLAGEYEVKHVIFASSSSVYGDQRGKPLNEEMANGKVVSPYAAAKYGAESFCHAFHHIYQYDLTILRFFTVYGPWGRPDLAIPTFIKKLERDEPITVFGENTARDYTYIDDIVSGIELALQQPNGYNIFNIGYGKPIKMEQLLSQLKHFYPNMKIVRKDWRTGDVTSTWANIDKAKEQLGFQAKVPFEEGLARTIEWARKYETN